MSTLNVDKVDPSTGTALELGSSGDTVSVPSGATLDISASTLTPPATMPASSGINLTALNATNLGSGTVPTARLGSGTASSSTVLYGDQTYKAEPGGGKVLQIVSDFSVSYQTTTSTSYVDLTGLSQAITCSATSSKVLVILSLQGVGAIVTESMKIILVRDINGGGYSSPLPSSVAVNEKVSSSNITGESVTHNFLDAPSSTDVVTYKLQGLSLGGGTAYFNAYNGSGVGSSLTLIEIGA